MKNINVIIKKKAVSIIITKPSNAGNATPTSAKSNINSPLFRPYSPLARAAFNPKANILFTRVKVLKDIVNR